MTDAITRDAAADEYIGLPLRETFNAPESRVEVTTLVIDMAGSTEIKAKQSEAAWLNQFGWLYEHVTEIVIQTIPGVMVKYIGDGLMGVCVSDEATAAITAAILTQEAIKKANRGEEGAKGIIDFNCYAAITTGKAVQFRTPDGNRDYVGGPIDKAHRLCNAANEKAILIDRATAAAANMGRVSSEVGRAMERTTDEYQGDLTRVMLKGFSQPVEFFEVLWDGQRYSVNHQTVTANTDRLQPVPMRKPAEQLATTERSSREERRHGRMKCWFADDGFGFAVDDTTGEEFYVPGKALIYQEDLRHLAKGTRVAFVAQDAPATGKKRRARGLLLVGRDAEGVLVSLPPQKPYGWIRVEGGPGNSHLVYAPLKDAAAKYVIGDVLTFEVAANEKGTFAADLAKAEEDAA